MDSLSHADQAESVWRRSHLQRTKDLLRRIGLILSNVDGNQRTPSESPPKEAATKGLLGSTASNLVQHCPGNNTKSSGAYWNGQSIPHTIVPSEGKSPLAKVQKDDFARMEMLVKTKSSFDTYVS